MFGTITSSESLLGRMKKSLPGSPSEFLEISLIHGISESFFFFFLFPPDRFRDLSRKFF
jgi:hypothetical protein